MSTEEKLSVFYVVDCENCKEVIWGRALFDPKTGEMTCIDDPECHSCFKEAAGGHDGNIFFMLDDAKRIINGEIEIPKELKALVL